MRIIKLAILLQWIFLAEALKANEMTEKECNDFIRNVKAVGSELPVGSIADYLKKFTVRSV